MTPPSALLNPAFDPTRPSRMVVCEICGYKRFSTENTGCSATMRNVQRAKEVAMAHWPAAIESPPLMSYYERQEAYYQAARHSATLEQLDAVLRDVKQRWEAEFAKRDAEGRQ